MPVLGSGQKTKQTYTSSIKKNLTTSFLQSLFQSLTTNCSTLVSTWPLGISTNVSNFAALEFSKIYPKNYVEVKMFEANLSRVSDVKY